MFGAPFMDIINKEKILEHAKKLVSEGRLDRAIVEYQHLLQLDPDDLRIKIKIAELHVKRKQISEAIRMYKDVAAGYADGGFYLKAVTVYKSILRLNPSLIDVNIALSELYEKMGLVQDALYQYQIVASAMEQKNDQNGVLNIREKMVALDPDNVQLRIRLAETYQLQGMTDKAIDMYEALAGQVKAKGDTQQLIELYTKILAHRPDKNEMVRELCNIYFKRGEWKEILKRMEAAKGFVENDPEMLAMQADIYARLNQIETAKGKYKELAELYADLKRPEDALDACSNILFLGPEDEEEVAKIAEGIREGSFADIKKMVEERRRMAVEDEKRREKEMQLAQERSERTEKIAEKLGLTPDELSVGGSDAARLEKEAAASYDLGVMYKKMGLREEGQAELLKSYRIYQRMAAAGRATELSLKRISELGVLFGEKEAPARGHFEPATKAPGPEKAAKAVKKGHEKAEDTEKKKGPAKKISFV